MRHRGSKKKVRQQGKKRKRQGDESSSSSSESDWRQEVWRRGFQGPLPPWGNPFWPMWPPAGPTTAPQYQGRQMRGAGQFQAQPTQTQAAGSWDGSWGGGAWSGAGREDGGQGRRKRPRWGSPVRHEPWGEEAYPADMADWDWRRRDPGGDFQEPVTKRRLPRPKPRPKPRPLPPPDEEDDDLDIFDPMLTMKVEVVDVPKKYIAKIIGKKGTQIRLIRDETGAHIDARDQSQDPCQVKVLGTPEAIEAARKKISEIIDLSINKPGHVLEIPRAKIGKVIGIRGAQIHEIQSSTGAKVDVDKDVDPCRVTVGGDDVQIAMAEKIILTLAMEAADQESEYLDLPSHVSGAVLGVRGARLMELQAASGARIDVDKTRPGTCRVRIAGTPDQIELAKELVLLATEAPRPSEAAILASEGVEQQASDANAAVDLPPGTAGKIIGRNGATIQSVQSETGARVWVDCEASQARISGQPGAVEHAKILVQALAEEAESDMQQAEAAANTVASVAQRAAGGLGGDWPALPGPQAEAGSGGEAGGEASGSDAAWAGATDAQGLDYWAGGWQEEAQPPPAVRPQTAMQRAFAALAAAKRGHAGQA